MKSVHVLSLCVALAAPQFAMAQANDNGQGLAIVRAILTFCAQVDPKDAATFKAQERSFAGGASEDALEKLEHSNGYKPSFEATLDALDKISKESARQTCAASVQP